MYTQTSFPKKGVYKRETNFSVNKFKLKKYMKKSYLKQSVFLLREEIVGTNKAREMPLKPPTLPPPKKRKREEDLFYSFASYFTIQ